MQISLLNKKDNSKSRMLVDLFILVSLLAEVILCIIQFVGPRDFVNELLFINNYFVLGLIIVYLILWGINKHFLLCCFYACFFLFLMGQKLIVYMSTGVYNEFLTFVLLQLDTSQYFTFTGLVFLSIITVFFSYRCVKFKQETCEPESVQSQEIRQNKLQNYKIILRYFVVISFVCTFIAQLMIILAKYGLSYTDGYLVNVDIPVVFLIGNSLYLGFLFLYLATRPSKLETFLLLAGFLVVEGVMQLFVGRRALMAKSLLLIIFYLIYYFKFNDKKMPLRYLLYAGIFAGIVIILFWFVEMIRGGNGTSFHLLQVLKKFFTSTGGSDSVIAHTIDKASNFPKSGLIYLIYPLKEAICQNALVELFTGHVSYVQGIEFIQHSDSFSHWISYLVNPDLYVKGYGMGSSYIAELYLAFGAFGVLIGGLALGVVIKLLSNLKLGSTKIWKTAIILFFSYNLFMLPRSGLFEWATNFLYLIAAILIFEFTVWIVRRIRMRRENGKL